jgi:putative tryptophan/tyrosine transport system substrate-binding protein
MPLRFLVVLIVFALFSPVEAQQPKKVPRIGILFAATPSANSERIEAFRQGLCERGYVEGKDVFIEQRYAEGNSTVSRRLPPSSCILKVDVIVSATPPGTRYLKEATNTIPIVMTNDTDPVGNNLVTTLARPGGNITGLSTLAPEISGKRLELLKEVVPKLSRVAVLGTLNASTAQLLKELEPAAAALKVQIQYLDVQGPKILRRRSERRPASTLTDCSR